MKTGSLRTNFIWNLLLRATRIIIPLITFPYVTRILQPEGLGRVSFAESFVTYLVLVAQLGVPTYGIRACARVRDDREKLSRTVHELVVINLVMSLISYAVLLACILAVPRIRNDWQMFAIFSINIIMNAVGMDWLYEGLERYSYITVRTLALRLVSVALVFLFVRRPEHALLYSGTIVVSTAGPKLVNLVHARRYISFCPMGGYQIKPHIKAAFTFFLMAGVTAIYTSLDKVMLGFMAGDTQVGYYSVAVKVKNVLFLCISALVAVLLPRSSYYVEKGKLGEHRELSNKALNYVFVAGFSLALFFFLYAMETVLFLSGREYLPAVGAMRIIMPGVALIGVTNVFTTQVLIPLGKERWVLAANTTGAVMDVLVNALLIPKFGAAGAAVGTMVAETGVFLTVVYHGRTYVNLKEIEYKKIAAALVIAGFAGWLFLRCGMQVFLKLACAGVIYYGSFAAVLLLLREKLTTDTVKSLLKRIKGR